MRVFQSGLSSPHSCSDIVVCCSTAVTTCLSSSFTRLPKGLTELRVGGALEGGIGARSAIGYVDGAGGGGALVAGGGGLEGACTL